MANKTVQLKDGNDNIYPSLAFGKSLNYVDLTYTGNITIGQSGFNNIASYFPTKPNNIVFAQIKTWNTNSGAFNIAVSADSAIYLFGTPNASISGYLTVRFFYAV